MNKLLTAIILATLALVSPQSQAILAPISAPNHYVWVAQTVTHAGRVRVTITRRKSKFYLAKLQSSKLSAEDNDDDYYDDLPEVQVGYRRPELIQVADVHDDVSDEIKIRLLLARKKALQAYQANWT
jgi:hypothetical protein